MPSGKKRKRHKMSTHKRKKRLSELPDEDALPLLRAMLKEGKHE